MTTFASPSRRVKRNTAVVPLTAVERALWQLGVPKLEALAVAKHKKRAKLGMLWCALRWPLLGMAALVAFVCLGRRWEGTAIVATAAVVLAILFGWLVNASELQWRTLGYNTFRAMHGVPRHVSVMADVLLSCGVSEERIGVEYLKNDPILFVEDAAQPSGVKRYDLIIW